MSLFVADYVLGLFGFPSEHPFVFSYEKNKTDSIKSIEYSTSFNTNSLGLRYKQLSIEKSTNEKRILVLGDSYVFGLGVEENETFCSKLEKHYSTTTNPVNFVNAGLIGTGPFHYAKLFFNLGTELNPDGVLICVYANDLQNCEPFPLNEELIYKDSINRTGLKKIVYTLFPKIYILAGGVFQKKYTVFRSYDVEKEIKKRINSGSVSKEDYLRWKQKVPLEYIEAVKNAEMNIHSISLGFFNSNEWLSNLDLSTEGDTFRWNNYCFFLNKITAYCKVNKIPVGIVYIPFRGQYDVHFYDDPHPMLHSGIKIKKEWLHSDAIIQKKLAIWAELKNSPFYDLTDTLRHMCKIDTALRLTFNVDDHFNKEGHERAAKALETWLDENTIFTFNKSHN